MLSEIFLALSTPYRTFFKNWRLIVVFFLSHGTSLALIRCFPQDIELQIWLILGFSLSGLIVGLVWNQPHIK